jgi:hypothetical protein
MVAEVFAGISSLKAAFDIAKGLKDIDDATRRNGAIIELQEKILSAQSAQSELIEAIAALKNRVAELEAWETEGQRYELCEISDGTFAYVVKEAMQGVEPKHALCPACYQKRQKSILQSMISANYGGQATCPACNLTLTFDVSDARSPFNFHRR